MQAIRDNLKQHFKVDIPIRITSGYRSKATNSMTANASDTSYHIWRLEASKSNGGLSLVTAVDFTVKLPPHISMEQVYNYLKSTVLGEFYWDKSEHRWVNPKPCTCKLSQDTGLRLPTMPHNPWFISIFFYLFLNLSNGVCLDPFFSDI